MPHRGARTLVFLIAILGSLVVSAPAGASRTYCYTWIGTYIYCNICEFYGPNDEYQGYVESCFERSF